MGLASWSERQGQVYIGKGTVLVDKWKFLRVCPRPGACLSTHRELAEGRVQSPRTGLGGRGASVRTRGCHCQPCLACPSCPSPSFSAQQGWAYTMCGVHILGQLPVPPRCPQIPNPVCFSDSSLSWHPVRGRWREGEGLILTWLIGLVAKPQGPNLPSDSFNQ